MFYQGNLLVHVNKAHGYYAGVPWIGDARKRRPRCVVKIADIEQSTEHWIQPAEAHWDEWFLFHLIHVDGSSLFQITMFITTDQTQQEIPLSTFFLELSTVLGHVGDQWHQLRGSVTKSDGETINSIRGEVNVEVRWYPHGIEIPQEVNAMIVKRADVSQLNLPLSPSSPNTLSVNTSHVLSPTGSRPPSSPTLTRPNSTPTQSWTTEQQRELIKVVVNQEMIPEQFSLFSSSKSTTTSALTSGLHENNSRESSSSSSHKRSASTSSSPSSSPSPASSSAGLISANGTSSLPQNLIPVTPFIYSSHSFGRMLPDSLAFDDRNFLEHHAGISRIQEILIWGDKSIQAIQFVFNIEGNRIAATKHGSPVVSPHVFTLSEDEHLLSIGGNKNDMGIIGLTLVTERQRRSYGASHSGLEFSDDFVCQPPSRGSRIVCIHGGVNDTMLNYIGICYQEIVSQETAGPETQHAAGGARGSLLKQQTNRKMHK